MDSLLQQEYVPETNRSKTMCKYWMYGSCKRGDSCWFAHGAGDPRFAPPFTTTAASGMPAACAGGYIGDDSAMQVYGDVTQQQWSHSSQGYMPAPQPLVNSYELDLDLLVAQQQLLEEQEQLLRMQEQQLQFSGICNVQQRQYDVRLGSANHSVGVEFGSGAVAAAGNMGGKRGSAASGVSEAGLAAWGIHEGNAAWSRGQQAVRSEFEEQGEGSYQVRVQ